MFWRQWCRDVASGADRHFDITFGLQVVDSLVTVIFREALKHPYISLFHLLVNGFSVIIITSSSTGFLGVYWSDHYIAYTLVTNLPEISTFINVFSFTVWTKKAAKEIQKQVTDCLQNMYQSVAIQLKYILLVYTLITSTKIFGLIICKTHWPHPQNDFLPRYLRLRT